jgi:hypothetical protein
MSFSTLISLSGILVAAAVALAVAHMHRKQLRQIELHRTDPSVPLIPPPHPATRFLRTYGIYLVFGVVDLAMLVREMGETTPVTRLVVFNIALDMIGITTMVFFAYVVSILNRLYNAAEKVAARMEKTAGKMVEIATRSD